MESLNKSFLKTWKFRSQNLQSVLGLFLMALLIAAIYIRNDTKMVEEDLSMEEDDTLRSCNLFSGKWIYDPKSFPLYREDECSFMIDDYACQKYGRKDKKYQHWRWQPNECNLPRFVCFLFLFIHSNTTTIKYI